jgi:phosphoglycerate-specific signal transduction histidine kinase
MQLSSMRNPKGVVTHLVRSYRDVTDTQELRSRLLATERVAAVGMLAAGIGHEIQNPLAYVELSLHAAERSLRRGDAQVEEMLHRLRDAREGAERIRLIVQDLRTFSREGGDERKPLDLREVAAPARSLAARARLSSTRSWWGSRLSAVLASCSACRRLVDSVTRATRSR